MITIPRFWRCAHESSGLGLDEGLIPVTFLVCKPAKQTAAGE